jgi:hypothetical protein
MSIIYILTNDSMPDYIKVGRTEREVQKRMLELDNTAVPLPFQCYYACEVDDYQKVERALHAAFDDFRVRKNREFFHKLDPHKVRTILELLSVREVTPRDEVFSEPDDAEAIEKVARSTKRFNFMEVGIPLGAVIHFVPDRSITAIVNGETTVEFDGETMTTSAAATRANESRGFSSSPLRGPTYWLYNGDTLSQVRMNIEASQVSETETGE